MSSTSKSLLKSIAIAGLIAGTLDISIACSMFTFTTGNSALIVLRYVASGFFGPEAFSGGVSMIVAGLVFHYIIAYSFTVAYFLLYGTISIVSKNRIINGILYGIIVWIIMNLVVLPLTNVSPLEFDTVKVIRGAVILIIAIGLPISYMANRHYAKQ